MRPTSTFEPNFFQNSCIAKNCEGIKIRPSAAQSLELNVRKGKQPNK